MISDIIKGRLRALSSDNPVDVQLEAIRAIAEDDTFDPTFLLPYHLSVDHDTFNQDLFLQDCLLGDRMSNASIILVKWGSPRIDAIIPGLFRWLQDLNWPGASEVLVLLYDLSEEKTAIPLQDAIAEAKRTNDVEWLEYLEYFASRVEHEQEDRRALEKHRKLIMESFGGIYP